MEKSKSMTMAHTAVNQASLVGLTAKGKTEIRNGDIAQGGVSAPDHFGFIAFGPECLVYTGSTRTEDRAPQGCDLSADSRAGMARGGFDTEAAPNSKQDPPILSLLPTKIS